MNNTTAGTIFTALVAGALVPYLADAGSTTIDTPVGQIQLDTPEIDEAVNVPPQEVNADSCYLDSNGNWQCPGRSKQVSREVSRNAVRVQQSRSVSSSGRFGLFSRLRSFRGNRGTRRCRCN